MKIVACPIKVLALFDSVTDDEGNRNPIPYQFRIKEESGEEILIKVEKRFPPKKSKVGGVESIIYPCQSIIDGVEKRYELKYLVARRTWQLYKY